MIRSVNIVGAQCYDTHTRVQHGQRPQEWGTPQSKYYGSVKDTRPICFKQPFLKMGSGTWPGKQKVELQSRLGYQSTFSCFKILRTDLLLLVFRL